MYRSFGHRDGGATEADGGASAPLGPTVAMPLAGIKEAIHAMNDLFTTHQDQGNGWGVLLLMQLMHSTC